MKKILMITFFVLLLIPSITFAQIVNNNIAGEQQNAVDLNQFKQTIEKVIGPDTNEIAPQFKLDTLIKDITSGNVSFNLKDMLNKVIKYLFKEIYANLGMITKIIVLVLICALLQNIQSSFGKEGVGEIAFYSCYILLAAMLIKNFIMLIDSGKAVIDNLVLFMQSFIPTIFTLLILTGNVTTTSVLQPGMIFGLGLISTLIKVVILPLILFYTVLAIVNNISNKVQVSKLADFIKNVGMWSMGILLTIFIAIIELQSTITSVADGITTRTAKYAVGTFIPVVGKVLSDAVETVIGYSILLKNSVSVVGMLVVILICAIPVIKLFAMIILYKLTAAVIQPISDERIVKCISEMAASLTFIAGALLSVAMIFIISISITMNAGNASAMLR